MLPCADPSSTFKAPGSDAGVSQGSDNSTSSDSASNSESSNSHKSSNGSIAMASHSGGDVLQQADDASTPGFMQHQASAKGDLQQQPKATVKSGPASPADSALNAIRAELAAMRVLLQLRLPPRPPTPASPLVPAAVDSATGAELASAYQLPHLLSPDSASAVALRASMLEEVRSVVRDALTTASPRHLRRFAGSVGRGISHAPLASQSEPLPAPRVLSVMAHRGDPAPWRGWSPSPTQSARPPRSPAVPVTPVDTGGPVSSAGGDQMALPLPQQVRPSAPPPSPNRQPARRRSYGAQSGSGERHSSPLASLKSQHKPPRAASPRLVMQEPTSEVQLGKQRGRPSSTGRVGLDRPIGGAAADSFPGACTCADCNCHYRPESLLFGCDYTLATVDTTAGPYLLVVFFATAQLSTGWGLVQAILLLEVPACKGGAASTACCLLPRLPLLSSSCL